MSKAKRILSEMDMVEQRLEKELQPLFDELENQSFVKDIDKTDGTELDVTVVDKRGKADVLTLAWDDKNNEYVWSDFSKDTPIGKKPEDAIKWLKKKLKVR